MVVQTIVGANEMNPSLKMASLQELRESLQGLSTACSDISSDKVDNI